MPKHTEQFQVRIDSAKLAKFQQLFPWRGSVSQFFDQCLEEFLKEWGDRPAPHDVVATSIRAVYNERY